MVKLGDEDLPDLVHVEDVVVGVGLQGLNQVVGACRDQQRMHELELPLQVGRALFFVFGESDVDEAAVRAPATHSHVAAFDSLQFGKDGNQLVVVNYLVLVVVLEGR